MLCALLMLTCWRGPLPCVHTHAADRAAEGRIESHAAGTLQGHLQWFHGGVSLETLSLGWHFHFIPWEDRDADGEPETTCHEGLTARLARASSDPGDTAAPGWDLDLLLALSDALCKSTHAEDASPRRSVETAAPAFRSGRDVRLLAGVMLL